MEYRKLDRVTRNFTSKRHDNIKAHVASNPGLPHPRFYLAALEKNRGRGRPGFGANIKENKERLGLNSSLRKLLFLNKQAIYMYMYMYREACVSYQLRCVYELIILLFGDDSGMEWIKWL